MYNLVEVLMPYWKRISEIHDITKELYIRSEEYSDELKAFIQPIKELKDAYEHIVRANSKAFCNDFKNEDINYIKSNMEKAIGHEYRAFFDTADFLCITLRSRIINRLEKFQYNQIIKEWSDYEIARKRIINITEDIATIRIKKDVGSSEQMYELIIRYKGIVEELIEFYRKIDLEVYPRLESLYK